MTQRLRSTSATTDAGGSSILVVEDDESVRLALSNLFQSVGLEVQLFGSASDMLQSKLPATASCLVLDVRLPAELLRQAEALGVRQNKAQSVR